MAFRLNGTGMIGGLFTSNSTLASAETGFTYQLSDEILSVQKEINGTTKN